MNKQKIGNIKIGDRFTNFMNNELRIMGLVENYWILEYKGYEPFVKHKNEMEEFLKFINATPIKLKNG